MAQVTQGMTRAALLLLVHLIGVAAFNCSSNSVDCGALSDLYATCTTASCLSNWNTAAQNGNVNVCTSLGGVTCDSTGRVNSLCV